MHRTLLSISLLISACFVQQIEDIIANHDVSSDATSSGGVDTSTGSDSTTGTAEPDTTSTGAETTTSTSGAEAGVDASSDPGSTGTDATSSSTGPTPPVCGDGILDPGETCDDMNDDPDDGCKLCTLDRIVFATSVRYQGFTLEGLFGADQRCRMLAAIANLPNHGTYRAWLSDSNTSAADRITHSRGRYTLVNGLVVAADWDALVSGMLEAPIDTTESSEESVDTCAWTGTFANGSRAFGSSFCDDWSGGDGLQKGGVGLGDQLGEWWSFFEYGGCGNMCALYCFEN